MASISCVIDVRSSRRPPAAQCSAQKNNAQSDFVDCVCLGCTHAIFVPRNKSIRAVDPVAFEPSSAGALLFSSLASAAIAVAVGYVRRMNYANARRSALGELERTLGTAARAEHDLTEKRQFYFHSPSVPIRAVMQHMTGSISLRAECTRSAQSDDRRQHWNASPARRRGDEDRLTISGSPRVIIISRILMSSWT